MAATLLLNTFYLFIFVANFVHFAKNTWEREYSIANSQFFKQKNSPKKEIFILKSPNLAQLLTISGKGAYDFLFSYFEYR